jgi:hypothetical protein
MRELFVFFFQFTEFFQPHYGPGARNLPEGGKGRLARKAENLSAICEPIV